MERIIRIFKGNSSILAAGMFGSFLTLALIAALKHLEEDKSIHNHCKLKIQAERNGRINAEKALRAGIVEKISDSSVGYPLLVIGKASSPYIARRGTPRQGLLVPDSRSFITLSNEIPVETLHGLEGYSHMFVQFIFHENTNLVKTLISQQTTNELNNRTSAAKSSTFSKRVHSFAAKVLPPLLKGGAIGLFATRSPHRPNAIGLSLVKIERVEIENRKIWISGADLVNGTPIVDLKPWGPFDCPTCIHNTVDHDGILKCDSGGRRCGYFNAKIPDWVNAGLSHPYKLPVEWSPESLDSLKVLLESSACSFYMEDEHQQLKNAIEQILSLDIRSLHRGHGQGPQVDENLSTDLIGDISKAMEIGIVQNYEVEFDNLNIHFFVKNGAHPVHSCNPWIMITNINKVQKQNSGFPE